MKTKVCCKCKIEKGISEFYKKTNSSDGHQNKCKECRKIILKKYREDHKEEIREYNKKYCRKYYKDNKEKLNKINKKYYEDHKEKLIQCANDWQKKHPYKVEDAKRKYYEENRKDCLMRTEEWRKNNPSRVSANARKYKAKRRQELGYEELFPNPFDGDVEWHHINNTYVVALPVNTHRQYYCGSDRETHRAMLEPIVYEIYYKDKEQGINT